MVKLCVLPTVLYYAIHRGTVHFDVLILKKFVITTEF